MTSTYPHLARECRTGKCSHEPGRCIRFRSPRCESGQCTHAANGLLCAVNYDADALPAPRRTAPPVDVRRPYSYRVERLDKPFPVALSHGHYSQPDGTVYTPAGAAQREMVNSRAGHSYRGRARVWIWNTDQAPDHHYRDPVPDCASQFNFDALPPVVSGVVGA